MKEQNQNFHRLHSALQTRRDAGHSYGVGNGARALRKRAGKAVARQHRHGNAAIQHNQLIIPRLPQPAQHMRRAGAQIYRQAAHRNRAVQADAGAAQQLRAHPSAAL